MTDVPAAQFVFGFGSLVAAGLRHVPRRDDDRRGFVADLSGHVRRWGVAMDNRRHIAGYKRYADPSTGTHPPVGVAFLDIAPAAGASAVNGLCQPVTDAQLAMLDARERNYVRVDVTGLVTGAPGRVWAYHGTAAARARRDAALHAGRLVVQRAYADLVLAAFTALGAGELAKYEATTSAPACPTRDLVREDLPLLSSAR